ncbi:hypothetical protein, partial [Pseudomonas atacamensis]|uniref:hypothetical protein n=1 Tax=Pseudomonas atacamensis TaxID=2565368 RepID=UPI002B1E0622
TLSLIQEELQEMVLDYVEYQLMKCVDNGDRNAIQYFLNAKGTHEGYGSYESRRRLGKKNLGGDGREKGFELD